MIHTLYIVPKLFADLINFMPDLTTKDGYVALIVPEPDKISYDEFVRMLGAVVGGKENIPMVEHFILLPAVGVLADFFLRWYRHEGWFKRPILSGIMGHTPESMHMRALSGAAEHYNFQHMLSLLNHVYCESEQTAQQIQAHYDCSTTTIHVFNEDAFLIDSPVLEEFDLSATLDRVHSTMKVRIGIHSDFTMNSSAMEELALINTLMDLPSQIRGAFEYEAVLFCPEPLREMGEQFCTIARQLGYEFSDVYFTPGRDTPEAHRLILDHCDTVLCILQDHPNLVAHNFPVVKILAVSDEIDSSNGAWGQPKRVIQDFICNAPTNMYTPHNVIPLQNGLLNFLRNKVNHSVMFNQQAESVAVAVMNKINHLLEVGGGEKIDREELVIRRKVAFRHLLNQFDMSRITIEL